MTQQPAERSRLRLALLGTLIMSLFTILVLRLWFLQVLEHETYQAAAEVNELRIVPLPPSRGEIVDRHGAVLARNRPAKVVSVRLDEIQEGDETLANLGELLDISPDELQARLSNRRVLPYQPIPIQEDVEEDLLVFIEENRDDFPGVVIETLPIRVYPNGSVASHVLGYVGEITADQLELDQFSDYRLGTIIGRSGLEFAYEPELRGQEGLVKLRVDSSGRVLPPLEGLGRREPVPGSTLVTSIDLRLQQVTEDSLAQGIERARGIFNREFGREYLAPAGAAVLMDPRNGEILAMASFPTYDPGAFVGGISQEEFDVLLNDEAKPLLNRVIQAELPVGSTFKVVTSAAALQEGIATRGGTYPCPTQYRYADQTFRNWRSVDSGNISIPQALVESCNTVFYDFGAEFWRRYRAGEGELLQEYARDFGFGSRTSVDLGTIFERPGVVPDSEWLVDMNSRLPDAFPYDTWLPGYTINLSIGQGDFKATPLQLAGAYGAIANGGELATPHVGLRVMDGERIVREISPEPRGKLDVSAANLATIKRGLVEVVTRGTGRSSFAGFPIEEIPVAAKTGTAELQTIPPSLPYAWFAAYAPADDPRFVVVVLLEEAGHGSETAGPIVKRIMEAAFDLPLSPLVTGARTD